MPKTIQCKIHGESERTYVCSHLAGDVVGLGFNREEPSEGKPCPDAWCDDCNVIFEAHNSWNEQNEELVSVQVLCSSCYENARIRNTRTGVTLEDLESLRWKCHTCEEWHTGVTLDFGSDAPIYWGDEEEKTKQSEPPDLSQLPQSFLNSDFCIIGGKNYFVRGVIQLPIIGTAETFCWGVWGSLSKENFEKYVLHYDDPERVELPPMFSWLSTRIADYEDTLNLKMYAHIPELDLRPIFELEPTDHQLSREHHHGITPERVKEIMTRNLNDVG